MTYNSSVVPLWFVLIVPHLVVDSYFSPQYFFFLDFYPRPQTFLADPKAVESIVWLVPVEQPHY